MGMFDKIRRKGPPPGPAPNHPEMLSCKLLFTQKPVINSSAILKEIKKSYPTVEIAGKGDSLLFAFPEIKVELSDATIPAQCSILGLAASAMLPTDALQQNWHWDDAERTASTCQYELIVNDLMTRALDYKTRQQLFTTFLVAVVTCTRPEVVYSLPARKLIPPSMLLDSWARQKGVLDILINVRLFNVSNSTEGELIMDTIGLHSFGLPDVEMRFINDDPKAVANLLWNYAYFLFEKGDIVRNGNTVDGPTAGSILTCMHAPSLTPPGRQVISIF